MWESDGSKFRSQPVTQSPWAYLRPTFFIPSVGVTTVSHSEVCLFLCAFSEFIYVDHCLVPSQSLVIVY